MKEDPEIDPEERLGEAIAAYLRAAETGRPPDRGEFLARHPQVALELDLFIENRQEVERLSRPLRNLVLPGKDVWKGRAFGDYEILGEIARGGMGVVYRARQARLNRTVALKMIRAGGGATQEDLQRFRAEAKAAASLSHPHIVPIYEFGEHEGQQYFTMELIEGHTLDRHGRDFISEPGEAARLIALVARAVHHAHQRRIIHRDLKPGNILVDRAGQPHVTDFGLAMRVEGGERLTESNVLLGTLPYMAPEQLSDKVQPLTTSVDIWSLGVILYELLTGKPPFQGKNQIDTLDRIRKQHPVPPGKLNRRVARDLEAICLKCLEKEPERRYGSALGLARDLERWLKGEPIEARPVHRVVRAWSWCRRNPAGAGLALGAAALLVAAAMGTMLHLAGKRAADEATMKGLVFTARFASSVILNRIQEWGTRVETVARSPGLVALLAKWKRSLKERPSADPDDLKGRPEARELQAFIDTLPKEAMVVNWQIMDSEGVMMARQPVTITGVNFRERDYLKGTLLHAGRAGLDSVHVSSVYRSQADGHDKFDICAPVAESGVTLGIVAVSVTTDPTLGVPHMHDDLHKVVLVAPWDPSPPRDLRPSGGPPEFVVLLHPGVTPGQEAVPFGKGSFPAVFPRDCEQELSMTESRPTAALARGDYLDPFGARDARFRGRWLAGFWPVGNTGFVVIVQQKAD
jgi:hypothetical protein